MATRKITLDQARAQYPHRYTMEHIPAWARRACEGNGKFYAPQFRSDAEWYAATRFPGEAGHIGHRSDCYTSGETWPLGQWLEAPFSASKAVPA